jgi:hypothetical protein
MPITPKREAPSKPAPSTVPTKEKDVIQIDHNTEDVGGSSKGTSNLMPSTEEEHKTLVEALANDASQRKEVVHGTPSMHPQFF